MQIGFQTIMNRFAPISCRMANPLVFACLMWAIAGCKPGAPTEANNAAQNKPAVQNPASVSKAQEPKKVTSLRALKLLESGRFDDAWDECQKVLLTSPNDTRALFVSAQVLVERKKIDQALAMVDRIAVADPEYGLLAHRSALVWCRDRFMLGAAEERANRILKLKPDDFETNKLFAALLDLQGRRYESSLCMQKLVALGATDLTTLVLALDTVKPVKSDEFSLEKFEEQTDASFRTQRPKHYPAHQWCGLRSARHHELPNHLACKGATHYPTGYSTHELFRKNSCLHAARIAHGTLRCKGRYF